MALTEKPSLPWVSVICTVFNQRRFIYDCLDAVFRQTYPHIELIVIDNGSTDGSGLEITRALSGKRNVKRIHRNVNAGLCKSFNSGLKLATGKYIIDLSGDDVLLPQRIEMQVLAFESLPEDYAVVFSNASFIDERGMERGHHFPVDARLNTISHVPQGDVFLAVLEKYFICTPTMMMRKSALDQLGGYDESLSFEDFDFWVRSARQFRYHYQDEILTQKRLHAGAMSLTITRCGNPLLESTLVVCRKALDLCNSLDERQALNRRIRSFIRKCFYTEQFGLAVRFARLLKKAGGRAGLVTTLVIALCRAHVPVNFVYSLYQGIKNKHLVIRNTPMFK